MSLQGSTTPSEKILYIGTIESFSNVYDLILVCLKSIHDELGSTDYRSFPMKGRDSTLQADFALTLDSLSNLFELCN